MNPEESKEAIQDVEMKDAVDNRIDRGTCESWDVRSTNTEDTEYRPEEGLSPTAWRNVKICLVVLGIAGNLIMRFGLVIGGYSAYWERRMYKGQNTRYIRFVQ